MNSVTSGVIIASKYEILNKLGEGSFGVIHEAYDIIEKKRIAIKFVVHSLGAHQLQGPATQLRVQGLPAHQGGRYCAQQESPKFICSAKKETTCF